MSEYKRLGVVGGAGMIGRAIVEGALRKKVFPPENVWVSDRNVKSLELVKEMGVQTTTDNDELVKNVDMILLTVEPRQAVGAIEECRDSFKDGQFLVSVVTGIRVADLRAATGDRLPVVRVMPNIAAIVSKSMTSMCPGPRVSDEQMAAATAVFDAVGATVVLDERHLDACTGLAGCGPAFAFKVIESLAAGGVKMGLPREASKTMAAWVLLGAATLVLDTGKHPAELKDAVTTPGGCTIDGLAKLEERGLPSALISAVETSTRRASELESLNGGGDKNKS